jgi:hypothetical protein
MSAARSLVVCLLVGLGFLVAGAAAATERVYSVWVAVTVLVELIALGFAVRVRRGFEPGEPNRTTWSLIVGFLAVRILAQIRLLSFYFDFIPGFIESSPGLSSFYTVWLRYLYTAADLLMVAALLNTIRAYRSLGLQFELRVRDWAVIGVVASMPLVVVTLRDQLTTDPMVADAELSLTIYRMVAASVGAVIAGLSLAVLRFVQQMGGGQLARVWGAIGVAGLARALSFVALALLSGISPAVADLGEQSMLWLFASAWLVGVLWQWQISRASGPVDA